MRSIPLVCIGITFCAVFCAGVLNAESAPPSATPQKPASTSATNAKTPIEPADNSYCYVCHRNYEKEKLTVIHTPAGIGCEKCHGVSERHSSDEDGITPPELMYPAVKINPFCIECHAVDPLRNRPEHQAALALLREKDPAKILTAGGVTKRLCTDCHGDHRLKVRTRRWDKATGKLLSDDGVRMMETGKPATLK
ncbi:MAG TPA: cytochrome c3 family protein [Candidatus Paceibacterota bacterium]|nr:cytochrome c3 family protein [Verrucomicrobiota bacterium]HRY48887.1 cytochrome c3 family protein [Candidatus Paceibacterota bacterium]HSA00689.1 cytochrome c3 family protein [Candidatus Paceibacterota bacterium]